MPGIEAIEKQPIREYQEHERDDAPLLREPESQWETTELVLVELLDKEHAAA